MIAVTISAEAEQKLAGLLRENKMSFVRLRKFAIGTPCSGRIFLGLALDEMDPADEVIKVNDITYIAQKEFLEEQGREFVVSLNAQGGFQVDQGHLAAARACGGCAAQDHQT